MGRFVFTEKETHPVLRIAIPNKGRLSEEARELFADAGLGVRTGSPRALIASLGGEFEGLFVRAQDIPEFVADGAADVGVTGLDLVRESGRELETVLDLGFGRCRLVLAARDESGIAGAGEIGDGVRVATSFPHLTREFFAARGAAVEVVPLSVVADAVEVAVTDAVEVEVVAFKNASMLNICFASVSIIKNFTVFRFIGERR